MDIITKLFFPSTINKLLENSLFKLKVDDFGKNHQRAH